jgi:phenylacetate-CoA ligase
MNHRWFCAQTAREHAWWKQDYKWRLSSVRAVHNQYEENNSWGSPLAEQAGSGPAQGIPLKWNVIDQLAKLHEFQPDMLNIHAGVLQAMCSYWAQTGYNLNLKQIKNTGETLSPEVRSYVKQITGVTVKDQYSSSEVGLISMNCEHEEQQHVQVETLLVEILNDADEPCQPGELGRVVITDFYNTVSPMIRYDIGDYARLGTACSCGRHSMTLSEIRGRSRGLFRRANGDRFWPTAGQYAAAEVCKINQWQIVQHSLTDIEYKLVTELPLTEEQLSKLLEIFKRTLGFDCVRITEYRTQLPIEGKYEESICLIE